MNFNSERIIIPTGCLKIQNENDGKRQRDDKPDLIRKSGLTRHETFAEFSSVPICEAFFNGFGIYLDAVHPSKQWTLGYFCVTGDYKINREFDLTSLFVSI